MLFVEFTLAFWYKCAHLVLDAAFTSALPLLEREGHSETFKLNKAFAQPIWTGFSATWSDTSILPAHVMNGQLSSASVQLKLVSMTLGTTRVKSQLKLIQTGSDSHPNIIIL